MSPDYRTHRLHPSTPSPASSRTSTPPLHDDDNIITPSHQRAPPITTTATAAATEMHAPLLPSQAEEELSRSRRRRRSSGQSYGSSGSAVPVPGSDVDTAELWQRMLAAQQEFHCYNSARVSAALEDDSVGAVVPSRLCLDLLNEHIALLPDEERRRVEYFIEHGDLKPGRRRSHWRR